MCASALRILTAISSALLNEALHIRLRRRPGHRDDPDRARSTGAAEPTVHRARPIGVLHGLMRAFLGATWRAARRRLQPPPAARPDHPSPGALTGRQVRPGLPDGLRVSTSKASTRRTRWRNHSCTPTPTSPSATSKRPRRPPTPMDPVRELIEILLPTSRCSVEQVARSLGVDRRSVRRRVRLRGPPHSSTPPAATSPRDWYAGRTARSPRSPRCSDSPPTATSPGGSAAASVAAPASGGGRPEGPPASRSAGWGTRCLARSRPRWSVHATASGGHCRAVTCSSPRAMTTPQPKHRHRRWPLARVHGRRPERSPAIRTTVAAAVVAMAERVLRSGEPVQGRGRSRSLPRPARARPRPLGLCLRVPERARTVDPACGYREPCHGLWPALSRPVDQPRARRRQRPA